MKKLLLILSGIIVSALVIFIIFSSAARRSLAIIENNEIDMSLVQNGIYTGHSELGPVKVDVKVEVENHRLKNIELLRHECGLGHPADLIVEKMVEKNTWDVDAVSGATVSSETIKNAVNKALH